MDRCTVSAPNGFLCSLRAGHANTHIAYENGREVARWPQAGSKSVEPSGGKVAKAEK